jgi:signal peptidase
MNRPVRHPSRWAPPGRFSLARRITPWVLFATAIGAWALFLRPNSLGGPVAYVTVSGTSMLPALDAGDLVVTTRAETYRVGDVVTYRVPADHPAAGAKVIHRIIGLDEAGRYLLRGDNANGPDVWHPTPSDVVGRVSFVVPGAGRLIGVLRTPALIAGLAAALAVLYLLGRPTAKPPAAVREAKAGGLAPAR